MMNTFEITGYRIVEDAMPCEYVMSHSECEVAAKALGLADITASYDLGFFPTDHPPFCYFEYERLYFNEFGTNNGSCSYSRNCLCSQNDFCVKFPCKEGQGDCDNDTECEGSLVCGHMNCVNNPYTDVFGYVRVSPLSSQ